MSDPETQTATPAPTETSLLQTIEARLKSIEEHLLHLNVGQRFAPYTAPVVEPVLPWNADQLYAKSAVVSFDGVSYTATAPSMNQTPPNAKFWGVTPPATPA
jgi:hypothetical protein